VRCFFLLCFFHGNELSISHKWAIIDKFEQFMFHSDKAQLIDLIRDLKAESDLVHFLYVFPYFCENGYVSFGLYCGILSDYSDSGIAKPKKFETQKITNAQTKPINQLCINFVS
jgi:hypothetical protein